MNKMTIRDLTTRGASGTLAEAEVRGKETAGKEWQLDSAQTIGEMETRAPKGGVELMLLAKRYKAVKRLGEGGMGSVWLAEDTKLDNRLVAIKMLPAVLAGKKGAYRQVKQEALMAMKLSHPNIATVRAFEEDEGGSPFLVMDYIEGEGLDDILAEKGPLGEKATLKLLGPVAAALDYAHSQGVVHRDVKPGNVIVRKDGTPFVLDFGIAREIQETMTRVTGKFSSGTLLYMSPEQLRGRAPKAAQDVYSFAAMAYECLAGHPPFYRGAVEDQIKNEPPEDLPEKVASAALRKSIMAGLAKGPEGRPGACVGVLENGGVSRPGEPGKGATAGIVAGKEARSTALPDGSPHQQQGAAEARPPARPLPSTNAGKAGRGDESGYLFLRKVRLEKGLEAAAREKDTTPAERAELARIRDFASAIDEAVRAGRDEAASGLVSEAMTALSAWQRTLAARHARDRAKAEAQRVARAAREVRLQAERERRQSAVREAEEKWMTEAGTEPQITVKAIKKFILFGGLGILFLFYMLYAIGLFSGP